MWNLNSGYSNEFRWEIQGRLDYSPGLAKIPITDRWGFSKKIFDEIWMRNELFKIRELDIKQIDIFTTKTNRFSATLKCFGHHSQWDSNASEFTIDIGLSEIAETATIDMIDKIFSGQTY